VPNFFGYTTQLRLSGEASFFEVLIQGFEQVDLPVEILLLILNPRSNETGPEVVRCADLIGPVLSVQD
jgi:hypothetical protein